ncbi:dihydrolipoamide acetyltransferase component of pyruvate dehydrogenase complex [Nocardia sputorum]|uniref:dihydrolipoamide acetyltransferase family protein n=1 Tax=Nocardia sputorum TaxID=2984338 RepID=UPI002490B36B|nr:dihydrolipoamide acetyltransferase family protein [Nocardia sputorum]BDT94549.1 dihydrolipoamide acetyltransferase component of pyruvate dehydrogenase complex [Nocardia sputorum]
MEDHARQDLSASVLEFRLPDLGEGLTDAELVSWAVAVGDTVELNQPIADVETAKAVVALPSPFAGRVIELLARPGDTVAVGAPLIRVQTAGADDTSEAGRASVLVGYGPEAETTSRRRPPAGSGVSRTDGGERKGPGVSRSDAVGDQAAEPNVPRSGGADSPTSQPHERQPETAAGAARAAATPAARKLARELGLDLWFIAGSGPGGAVTVEDVRGAVPVSQPRPADQAIVPPEAVRPSAREERTPIGGIRKRTAAAMLTSARTIPQASTFVTADCTAAMELLDHLRSTKPFAGLSLTPLALVAKATLAALSDFPGMNVCWDEAAQEIVTKHYVNLGIAVATERGLLVPNIKDAQTLNLRDLTREIGWLADTARTGDATPADLRGGTFTITNVGVFGVDAGVPLVNPGEAAILCLGSIGRRPWVVRDEIAIRWVTTLGVSFDHRMIDGELASRFLATVAGFLEDPLTLLSRA